MMAKIRSFDYDIGIGGSDGARDLPNCSNEIQVLINSCAVQPFSTKRLAHFPTTLEWLDNCSLVMIKVTW